MCIHQISNGALSARFRGTQNRNEETATAGAAAAVAVHTDIHRVTHSLWLCTQKLYAYKLSNTIHVLHTPFKSNGARTKNHFVERRKNA